MGISLDLRATIESVEVMPAEESFGSRKSSDKHQLKPEANRRVVSTLWDVVAKIFASNRE
jgi:hypothetical protein